MSVLGQHALVLNKNWMAIATTTVRDAITLMARGAAEAVCTETYETHDLDSWAELAVLKDQEFIRTVQVSVRVPEIIRLNLYDKIPPREVVFSRKNLYRRDKYTCQYCSIQPGTHELTIDHVVPKSRGGRTTWENCVLCCVPCNNRKGSRLANEARMKLLSVPKKPNWNPHLTFKMGRVRESWEQFISRKYWETELVD